jgi:hypothetical protein
MKLKDLYRDVYSQLNVHGNEHSISSLDIIKALNQTIRLLRAEYVKNGLAGYFAETEVVQGFYQDYQYEFLSRGTLSKTLIAEVPVEQAILSSNVKITINKIADETQTWKEGDTAEYDGMLYEAVKDITDTNTYGKVFDSKNLRIYYPNNGLKYKAGEIVWNPDTNQYYKVSSGFIATDDVENLDEVFWRKIGNANIVANHYPINLLRNVVLHDNLTQAFSIYNNQVYVNPKVQELTITYVPEWRYIQDLETDVNIPDQMELQVIQQTTNKLLRKVTQTPTEETNE